MTEKDAWFHLYGDMLVIGEMLIQENTGMLFLKTPYTIKEGFFLSGSKIIKLSKNGSLNPDLDSVYHPRVRNV